MGVDLEGIYFIHSELGLYAGEQLFELGLSELDVYLEFGTPVMVMEALRQIFPQSEVGYLEKRMVAHISDTIVNHEP